MTEHIEGKKTSSRRHLSAASEIILPRTLGELAGESNTAAGLEKKLGEDALWLFADSVYAYADDGESTRFDDTQDIPIPVQYGGLRQIMDEDDEALSGYRTLLHEQLAVFTVVPDMREEIEQYYDHAVYDYPEVAVRLGQLVSLLETYEVNPRILLWHQRQQRPFLIRSRRPTTETLHRKPN